MHHLVGHVLASLRLERGAFGVAMSKGAMWQRIQEFNRGEVMARTLRFRFGPVGRFGGRGRRAVLVFPKGGSYLGRVYSDGSRLDGPCPLLARNGWSFIVLDEDENLIAAEYGLPLDWVDDVRGTEAWAMMQAALFAILGCNSSSIANRAWMPSIKARWPVDLTRTLWQKIMA